MKPSFTHGLFTFVLFSGLMLSGCTNNLIREDFPGNRDYLNRINELAKNSGPAEVTLKNDSTFSLQNLSITRDSISANEFVIPNTSVKSISFISHTSNLLTGISVGVIGGLILGIIQYGSSDNNASEISMITSASALLGGFISVIIGEEELFSFDQPIPDAELRKFIASRKSGLKFGIHSGFKPEFFKTDNKINPFISYNSEPLQGFTLTWFYNFPFNQYYLLCSEVSYINAGSNENYSAIINARTISGSSKETTKAVQLSALMRLNFYKNGFTPYFLIGPNLDFIISKNNSSRELFFRDISDNYGNGKFRKSFDQNSLIVGLTIGGGLSTGKLFPFEVLADFRYNLDVTSRLTYIDDDFYLPSGFRYKSNSFGLTLGFALF